MDAIGDIAVCIVNAAKLDDSMKPLELQLYYEEAYLAEIAGFIVDGNYEPALSSLADYALSEGHDIWGCLEAAWGEIKDRKGMMIDGKYVKWQSMTEEQKAEFNRRDSGNTLIRA